jgi:tetratricopeptide (TPR) repeat protein
MHRMRSLSMAVVVALAPVGVSSAQAQDAPAKESAPAPASEAAPPPAAAPPAPPASPVDAADALMKTRKLKSAEEALPLYKAALAKDPENLDLLWKTADCMNMIMRIKTDGNMVRVEGAGDTPAARKVWSTYGADAYAYAKKVATARPKSIEAQATLAEAFMFHSSSFGIIKAITSGVTPEYKANAKTLMTLDAKHEGGVGYSYMVGFNLVAPWPVSDLDEAQENVDKALAIDSKSARNLYYAGLVARKQGDDAKAKDFFERSLKVPCSTPADNDVCAAYRREAKKGIEVTSK